jgi:N-acyl-D-amino-acid deacylase
VAELLGDSSIRARLRTECDRYWRFLHRGEWERVYLQGDHRFPDYAGKNFREIAELTGTDPWDVYFDILRTAGLEMESMQLVGMLFTDEHLAEMIRHPLFSLTADTWSSRIDGPLAEQTRHPICFAGHIHFLTHHTRAMHTLRLEDTIRKLTSMPAAHFRLRDRGLLRPGAFADVVVFDYERLEDGSTLEQPLAYARGVEQVFINGTHVLVDGQHNGLRPGRLLLRER